MRWSGTVALAGAVLLLAAGGAARAQDQQQGPPPDAQASNEPPPQNAPALPAQQLDSLVAPIALYPDPLLSQVLVASTYPLEIVEAAQWLQQNGNLTGQQLVDAALQQNWDASIQALVPFPDVIRRLAQDVRWATDLGNAFLSQQGDVMSAVQRMRQQARAAGKLQSNEQQTVSMEDQNGQEAIDVQPANPQMMYVPDYDPAFIWGDIGYPYPGLFYPNYGFGFGPGISLGFYFGGCCGWGGWGWGPNWFGRSIFVNNSFLHRYRFNDFHGGGFSGRGVWQHDPTHRLGVPYSNRVLSERYRGSVNSFRGGQGFAGREQGFAGRSAAGVPEARGFNRETPQVRQQFSEPGERLGNRQIPQRTFGENHSAFGPVENGNRARIQSDHGFASGGSRGYTQRAAPAPHFSAPAPRASAPSRGGGGRR